MKSSFSLTIFLAGIILVCPALKSQETKVSDAPWAKQISPIPKANLPAVRPVKFSYELTWKKRVKAGKATVVIAPSKKQPGVVNASCNGRASGLAGKLFPYNFSTHSVINYSDGLESVTTVLKDETRKNRNVNTLVFSDDKVATEKKNYDKKTKKNTSHKRDYTSGDRRLAQDAFSVLLSARAQPLTKNQVITALVVPVDKPYLIKFTVLGRETRELKGKSYKTIKLDLNIVGRVNTDSTIKPYDKLQGCTLWITDDADRLPLELKADIFVGHFSAYLTSKEFLK